MKKLTILMTFVLVASMVFMGCKKDEEPTVDPRDAWVGNYTEVLNGTMTINIPGQPMTVPFSDSGSFRVEKGSAENRIVRIDNDTTRTGGTINGNQVVFDPVTETVEEQGMVITTTANASGTLNGKVVNYSVILSGSAVMAGYAIPITGTITGVATKQ